jgi:hypothetical protein
LNFDRPPLFQNDSVKVQLYLKYYDDACIFYTALPALPREFEQVNFPFVKAKVGTDFFWVNRIQHEITENRTNIVVWLKGGILNKYREYVLDKALFQGWIGLMDVYHKHDIQIDNELKNIYRH